MSIDSTWLRCPNCTLPLAAVGDRVVGCAEGHRFDLSKYGTVTLLPPRAPQTVGDSREMLDARAALLGSGVFEPIAAAIGEACAPRALDAPDPLRIADLGCGTGYYAARLAADFPGAALLLADRSPIAVRIASKAVPNATGVVLDLWRPLPIRDGIADVAINVFAPRNAVEFARILRPGGSLIVVVPSERHLEQLRTRGGMLDIPGGKAEQVGEQLVRAEFGLDASRRVEYLAPLGPAHVRALVAMGPSAHHVTKGADAAGSADLDSGATIDVTVSVDVLRFRRT
ncbi:MAG TPA: methyltransferase domain-containing protein [Vicinamibacterales bacterium]